jgi:RNA polymerase sigma factor (sigma-70 family)
MAGVPGERERLRQALMTDQGGILSATRLRLARLARARGMPTPAIDDVVQETLLEAWSHLDRLQEVEGFRPWIDEICRNVCRRANRSQQRKLMREAVSLPAPFPFDEGGRDEPDERRYELPDTSAFDPVEELSRQDLARLLDRALGSLPAATRQLVELSYLVELPRDEVAARLQLSAGALDTRLHRARRHLRRILTGPLREEVDGYGLRIDVLPDEQWQPTRLWCPQCAQRRLDGCFITIPSQDGPNVHLRCPDCSRRFGRDAVHSMSLVSLAGLHAFRPVWKRTMQGLSNQLLQALAASRSPCLNCGHPIEYQVLGADDATLPPEAPPLFGIYAKCNRCGGWVGTGDGGFPTLDQLVYWSHPRTRQFLQDHQRFASSPGQDIDFGGSAAILFHLADLEAADQLSVVAERQSLRILSIE